MKECPKCGIEHSKPGIFCSRKCSNSRKQSDETKKKIAIAVIEQQKKSPRIYSGNAPEAYEKMKETWKKKRHERNFDDLSFSAKRRVVIEQQNYQCSICHLDKWLDKPIILEIDHIDGNNKNDARENLVALCPNCHSMTPTWRGRNKKNACEALR